MDIEELLVRHWEDLLELREEHFGYMLSTKAADREKLDSAIASIYRFAELEPPKQIIWFDSQIEARICVALWLWTLDPFIHAVTIHNESGSALLQSVGQFFDAQNKESMEEFPSLFSSSEEPELLLSEQFKELFGFDHQGELGDLLGVLSTDVTVLSTDPLRLALSDGMAALNRLAGYIEDPQATTDAIIRKALDSDVYPQDKLVKQELFGAAFSMNLRSNMISPFNEELTKIIETGMVETLLSAHDKVRMVLQVNRSEWDLLATKLAKISEEENSEFYSWLGQKGRVLSALTSSRSSMADAFDSAKHRAVALMAKQTVRSAQPLFEAVTAGGWWWPFKDICFACDNPAEIHVDNQRRLHNEDGMAVRFRDGRGFWALNDVVVEEKVIRNEYSAVDIDSLGVHSPQREIMIRRFGLTRYLQESQAEEIHKDDYGVLYQKTLSNGKTVGIIVTDPISETQFSPFSILVPAEITTATEAVEWTALQAKFVAGL